ncbi:aldo/keto reductase [Reyranella sp. CPCC 100927]|uniref:aldo/keto reductase n=1 Tax=Reyranella sp. CPCC 100927 TaxID=2599616 RepID=UPI0011B4B692|nr:aldo/keto reductase [Reyranella sp. CPCC 100927]TWT11793.1 aldo/keto reductase [Reyranella sp. CPCC 100927]
MDYTTLGRTGLRVSVAGLGCGGNSRIGRGTGLGEDESVALVREALDLGVNFIDTAEAYGTEDLVGRAIQAVPRDSVVISTKCLTRHGGNLQSATDVVRALEDSLGRLGTEYVDVFHLHAVAPAAYAHARDVLAPALLREKEKGKLRHLGITETGPHDPQQAMLQQAVHDPCWEVMMLAFHMMNQGARRQVFPHTRREGIGTLLMFVVRNIFSVPGLLAQTVKGLVAEGRLPARFGDTEAPLDFLLHAGGATSLTDAAYRFARHEPGADVVLFGTGKRAHLRANIESILKPPLPAADVRTLYDLFGDLQGVGLDLPGRVQAKA